MKQTHIIQLKLWDAWQNNKDAVFPVAFYTKDEVEYGMNNSFDKRHIRMTFSEGQTDKGFDAYIVKVERIITNRNKE